jgi:hypothetical protein
VTAWRHDEEVRFSAHTLIVDVAGTPKVRARRNTFR